MLYALQTQETRRKRSWGNLPMCVGTDDAKRQKFPKKRITFFKLLLDFVTISTMKDNLSRYGDPGLDDTLRYTLEGTKKVAREIGNQLGELKGRQANGKILQQQIADAQQQLNQIKIDNGRLAAQQTAMTGTIRRHNYLDEKQRDIKAQKVEETVRKWRGASLNASAIVIGTSPFLPAAIDVLDKLK